MHSGDLSNFTEGERRLVMRRRSVWGKLFRWVGIFLSVVGCLAVIFVTIVSLQIDKKVAYQNSIEAIRAGARSASPRIVIIPANQYAQQPVATETEESRLVADYVEIMLRKCDSHKLTFDKRLGFRFEVMVAPCGQFGKRQTAGTMSVYSSYCGCDTDSAFDQTVLEIDPIDKNANVISSHKVALANIQP